MFALLKEKKLYEEAVRRIYASILAYVRQPVFYTGYGVPDTLDGRFDLLTLHIFIVMNRVMDHGDAEDFNQMLFDITFSDMDQMLREMGIGDMGVPKRMRRMMKAFNGRVHMYQDVVGDSEALEQALVRNLYSTLDNKSTAPVKKMSAYIQNQIAFIKAQDLSDIMSGTVIFEGDAHV